MIKKKAGFTLLELTVSLFLLGILALLLMLILETTLKTSNKFLDYTGYEYAMAHKKIFETYNASEKVERTSNYIFMTSKENDEEVALIFRGSRVFMEKRKKTDSYRGNILLLKRLKSYSISQDGDLITIELVDRNYHKYIMNIMEKDIKDKEDKDKKDKEKREDNSQENNDDKKEDDKDNKNIFPENNKNDT